MKKMLLLGLLLLSVNVSYGIQYIEYQLKPVKIVLQVGKEQVIDFGQSASVGLTQQLVNGAIFRNQSVNGTVYWLAYREFDEQRLQVKLSDGTIYLFDVKASSASDEGEVEPIAIIEKSVEDVISNGAGEVDNVSISAQELIRYVAHQFYAPKRLHKKMMGVRRVSMGLPEELPLLISDGGIKANPKASWLGGGLYVTAIELKNSSNYPVTLDPRHLVGRISYAAFQHNTLLASGSAGDTTMVYVVTELPINAAVYY